MGSREKLGGESIRKSLSKMFLADFADFLWSSYSFQISIQSSQTINFHEFITFNYSSFQTFYKWDLHPIGAANIYQAVSSPKFIYYFIFSYFPFSHLSLSHCQQVHSFGTFLTESEVHGTLYLSGLLLTHSLTLAPSSSFVLISVPFSKSFSYEFNRVLQAEAEILEMLHPHNARWNCLVEAKYLQRQMDDSHNSG